MSSNIRTRTQYADALRQQLWLAAQQMSDLHVFCVSQLTKQICDRGLFDPLRSGCRYEVNFQDGIDCGGAYIKLLSDTEDLSLVGVKDS